MAFGGPDGRDAAVRPATPVLTVLASGARTAVARSARQLAALARVDKADVRGSGLTDGEGYRVRMALASRLPADARGLARLIALSVPALREAVLTAQRRAGRAFEEPIPVFLAAPESARPDADPARDRELLEAMAEMSGVPLDLARSEIFPLGHAGFIAALAAASAALARGGAGAKAALVGGVDSYNDPAVLSWLDARGRRHVSGMETGILPGEGGAFLLLARSPSGSSESGAISTWLSSAATASDETAALRTALSSSPALPRRVLTHDTGDPERRAEWTRLGITGPVDGTALPPRAPRALDLELETMPPSMGDAGAATGPLLAAIADIRLRDGHGEREPIAVALRSDDGTSGVFVMGCRVVRSPAVPAGAPPPEIAPTPESGDIDDLARACLFVLERTSAIRGAERAERARTFDAAWHALTALREAASHRGSPASIEDLDRADSALQTARAGAGRGATGARRDAVLRLEAIARHVTAARTGMLATPPASPADRLDSAAGHPPSEDRPTGPLRGTPVLRSLDTAAWSPFSWRFAPSSPDSTPRALSLEERSFARLCVDHIERLRWQRALAPDSPWSPSLVDTEDRLLAHLDALFALAGPAWGVYAGGLPPDTSADILSDLFAPPHATSSGWTPVFARTLFLCSIDSDLGPRTAAMSVTRPLEHREKSRPIFDISCPPPAALRASAPPKSPAPPAQGGVRDAELDAFRCALKLAPSPGVETLLEDLLAGNDTSLILIALDVLRARSGARFAPLVPLSAHPDIAVRAAAVRAMARTPDTEVARGFLERLAFLHHPPEVALAIADSLLRLDARAGLELARDCLLRRPTNAPSMPVALRSSFLRLVALAGPATDFRLFETATEPDDIESIGWLGHAGAADWLLAKLSDPAAHESVNSPQRAAAVALHRLTGAAPDELDAAAAPGLDASRWAAYWHRRRATFSATHKLRHGQPITPGAVLDELLCPGVLQSHRVTCLDELALMLPGVPLPAPDDWTARQIATLTALRGSFDRGDLRDLHAPGDRIAARLGRRRPARG